MPENVLKTLANRVRYHRKKRKLTQVQLSNDSGVEHRHLQKIEAGTVDVRIGTIKKLATSLNVPTCFLLEDFVPVTQLLGDREELRPIELISEIKIPAAAFGEDLSVRYANNAFYEMIAHEPKEGMKGLSLHKFLARSEESEKVNWLSEQILKERPQPQPFMMEMKAKSGEIFQRLVHWDYVNGPENKPIGYVVFYLDPEPREVKRSMFDLVPQGSAS